MTATQVTYPPDRRTLLLRIAACFAFVLIAAWTATVSLTGSGIVTAAILAACGAYFAFIGATYIAALVDRAGLNADDRGFSYRYLWGRRRASWQEVSDFTVAKYGSLRVIAFNRPDASDNWLTRRNRSMIGVSDFILAHNFTAPLGEVCRTLNEFRIQAISRA